MSLEYRLGSLFSGIGGFELGFELTGRFKTVFQVEIDPKARAVLAKHWSHIPRFEDVKEVSSKNLPRCDILCGGFPCQGISNAGRKLGLEDERSGLWWEFHRIIGDIRPQVVVVENVAALAIRGLDTVIGSLSQIGYDAEWDIVSAAQVGAYHLRERIFIVAYPSSKSVRGQSRPAWRENLATIHPKPSRERVFAYSDSFGYTPSQQLEEEKKHQLSDFPDWAGGEWRPPHSANPRSKSSVHRVGDGLSQGLDITLNDRLRMLGNAVVPQVAYHVAQRVLKSGLLEVFP